jgi:hypothetical protein
VKDYNVTFYQEVKVAGPIFVVSVMVLFKLNMVIPTTILVMNVMNLVLIVCMLVTLIVFLVLWDILNISVNSDKNHVTMKSA